MSVDMVLWFLNHVIYTVFKEFFSETGKKKNWQEGIIMNREIVLYDGSYKKCHNALH